MEYGNAPILTLDEIALFFTRKGEKERGIIEFLSWFGHYPLIA